MLMFTSAVVGSMRVTGWDNQALQAATIEWWGEGTCMALIAMSGLVWLVLSYIVRTPPTPPPITLMCNLGNVPLAHLIEKIYIQHPAEHQQRLSMCMHGDHCSASPRIEASYLPQKHTHEVDWQWFLAWKSSHQEAWLLPWPPVLLWAFS